MSWFELVLIVAAVAAIGTWAVLSLYVIQVQRRRAAARATASRARAALEGADVAGLSLAERLDRVRPILDDASRELIMHAAADLDTPLASGEVLAAYLVERWGEEGLEQDARAHRTARDKWRRMKALQILARRDHARSMELLATAVDGP